MPFNNGYSSVPMAYNLPPLGILNEFEQFQSLALEVCAKEIDVACDALGISAGMFESLMLV